MSDNERLQKLVAKWRKQGEKYRQIGMGDFAQEAGSYVDELSILIAELSRTQLAGERLHEKWMIVFHDPDRPPLFFEGLDARRTAAETHKKLCDSWTCELFLSAADLPNVVAQPADGQVEAFKRFLGDEEWTPDEIDFTQQAFAAGVKWAAQPADGALREALERILVQWRESIEILKKANAALDGKYHLNEISRYLCCTADVERALAAQREEES